MKLPAFTETTKTIGVEYFTLQRFREEYSSMLAAAFNCRKYRIH